MKDVSIYSLLSSKYPPSECVIMKEVSNAIKHSIEKEIKAYQCQSTSIKETN